MCILSVLLFITEIIDVYIYLPVCGVLGYIPHAMKQFIRWMVKAFGREYDAIITTIFSVPSPPSASRRKHEQGETTASNLR